MSAAIRISGLGKSYGRVPVLSDLHLEVPESSVFGQIGPNGAGKTTTIRILMNILQPDSGSAELLGKDSCRLDWEDFRQIGYVSENQKLPGWMTVDYLMTHLKPLYPNWNDAVASSLLTSFELPPDRKLGHLSRGMYMKAALASSLAYEPKLLVMDEPFTGLDPLVREDLIESLSAKARNATILVSSHDLGELESFATHIAYIDQGKLRFAEEISSLIARFRRIEVTFEENSWCAEVSAWPEAWIRRESGPVFARFVDSKFDVNRTPRDIAEAFGAVRDVVVEPMPLRSIFLVIARHIRTTN
jgi:ABC-2 type transport system ATP-binding protein